METIINVISIYTSNIFANLKKFDYFYVNVFNVINSMLSINSSTYSMFSFQNYKKQLIT